MIEDAHPPRLDGRADRWQREKELLADALELEPNQREAFFARLATADSELASHLRRLAHAETRATDFLDVPVLSDPARYLPELLGLAPGTRVGTFEIEHVVGLGGSSVVYAARQERPRRRVALKIFAADLRHTRARTRFEAEAELLGRLRHPAIAQVFAAATFDDPNGNHGTRTPFLAVEWIAGAQPITRWARATNASREAVLERFIEVCAAIQHGHDRGIVHRDLKPENVLVDEDGRPKVIDFGIGRLVGTDEDPAAFVTRPTRTGELVGTLPYMSPEQCAGDARAGERPTDVYALGVLLYELLLGRLPFDLAGRPLRAALAAIENEPPLRPRAVDPTLDPDLEAILCKALEKEPARRYASPGALARDLVRWRTLDPVDARRPSFGYHARLFLRRHKLGVLTTSLVLATVLGAALSITLSSMRASRVAERERRSAEEVTSFVTSILALAGPSEEHGPDLLMRDVLALASERIQADLAGEPRARWSLHNAIAHAYWELGLYAESAEHYARSLAIVRDLDRAGALRPDETCALPAVLDNLGFALIADARGTEAAAVLREAAAYHEEHAGLAPFMRAITDHLLARALRLTGDLAEAERRARSALAVYTASWGSDSTAVAGAHASLAEILRDRGALEPAVAEAERALAIQLAAHGEGSVEVARARCLSASLCVDRGALTNARPLLERAITDLGRVLPPEHPDLTRAQRLLASLN